MATLTCDDPKAYAAIPDRAFDCLLPRRHSFPTSRQRIQNVNLPYDGGVLELTEFYGTCDQCGATRTLFRYRQTRTCAWTEYVYPDGYRAPAGRRWDVDLLWEEFYRRNPIKGRTKTGRR